MAKCLNALFDLIVRLVEKIARGFKDLERKK